MNRQSSRSRVRAVVLVMAWCLYPALADPAFKDWREADSKAFDAFRHGTPTNPPRSSTASTHTSVSPDSPTPPAKARAVMTPDTPVFRLDGSDDSTAQVPEVAVADEALDASPASDQASRWVAKIPHPDTVDWSSSDRPGYRYRGMLPAQARFYQYIQGKRLRGDALTGVEVIMIRSLQAARRWPEPPRPNAAARAYLQNIRTQPDLELNTAHQLMLAQLRAQGLLPQDTDMGPEIQRLTEYLNSEPFRARNFFERWTGRVEHWLMFGGASQAIAMQFPGTPGRHEAPRAPGVSIEYSIAGATVQRAPTDAWLRQYEGTPIFEYDQGVPLPGQVTVSGVVTSGEDYRVRFTAHMDNGAGLLEEWGEGRLRTKSVWEEKVINLEPGESQPFTITAPTLPQCEPGNPNREGYVRITLRTRCTEAGGHQQTLTDGNPLVAILLDPCPAAWSAWSLEDARRRADAAWQAQVERTLQELGNEQTQAGREIARMQDALADGDVGWQAYVDEQARRFADSEDLTERQFDALQAAVEADEPSWNAYLDSQQIPSLPPPDPSLP